MQIGLASLPTWEVWSMGRAPTQVRDAYDELVFMPEYEKKCLLCNGKKKAVSSCVRDTPQAYEQIEPETATRDLRWCAALTRLLTRKDTVTIVRENSGASFLGGVTASLLMMNASYVILSFPEVIQYVSALFCLVYV